MVTELLSEGDLYTLIFKDRVFVPAAKKNHVLASVALGMEYLHRKVRAKCRNDCRCVVVVPLLRCSCTVVAFLLYRCCVCCTIVALLLCGSCSAGNFGRGIIVVVDDVKLHIRFWTRVVVAHRFFFLLCYSPVRATSYLPLFPRRTLCTAT